MHDRVDASQAGGVHGAGPGIPADLAGLGGAADQWHDGVPGCGQVRRQRPADQARGAGDGDLHDGSLLPGGECQVGGGAAVAVGEHALEPGPDQRVRQRAEAAQRQPVGHVVDEDAAPLAQGLEAVTVIPGGEGP